MTLPDQVQEGLRKALQTFGQRVSEIKEDLVSVHLARRGLSLEDACRDETAFRDSLGGVVLRSLDAVAAQPFGSKRHLKSVLKAGATELVMRALELSAISQEGAAILLVVVRSFEDGSSPVLALRQLCAQRPRVLESLPPDFYATLLGFLPETVSPTSNIKTRDALAEVLPAGHRERVFRKE